MLTLYRRHLDSCPHKAKGRAWMKCECPLHADGMVKGRRVRESLDTVNMGRARRRLAEIDEGKIRKPVPDATEAFLESRNLEPSTLRKYTRVMTRLREFAGPRGLATLDRITLENLDAYRSTRALNALSWSKELQLLRTFFSFAMKRKWCEENPARDMEMPRDPKPRPREPYTSDEITRILAACETFGKGAYERLRARAMVLLLWRYALRISDVATLKRDRVRDGRIFLHALKNGAALWLPLRAEVRGALDALPLPQGASADCRYFFWTGAGSRDEHIKTVGRTLQAVFRMSGVERASAHRFRHTLATKILVEGGTIDDAANILGDSPAIIRKHYAKWSADYQRRTIELFERVHGTPVAREEILPESDLFSTVNLVPGVGIEPTLSLRKKGF